MGLRIRTISSLEKVFIDQELSAPEVLQGSAAGGEIYSFQVAAYVEPENNYNPQRSFKITTESALPVEVRDVVSMPSEVPYLVEDDNLLRKKPGLFPDLLDNLVNENRWRIPGAQWRALWITVRVPLDCKAGKYPVKIALTNGGTDWRGVENPEEIDTTFELEVLPFNLPETKLLRYEWLHCDCLASYYKVNMWSEEHWNIVEKFVANATAHEMNMLLTPLWTPPLDTAIGHERPTTQLLDIVKDGDKYSFGFTRLERYIELGKRYGVKRFAMSHAFTQWGAKATPKIVATVNGKEERIFGWDVPANSNEYSDFLDQLMPLLIAKFKELEIIDKVFFSVSDEPYVDNIDNYTYASKLLKSKIGNLPTIDALSSFEFHKRGLVERPVVSNNHIEPFVGNVKEMWTYYCVSQGVKVPNRFFAMPSARTRIMGLMLYLYDAVGFLQWAYNFYYSQFSLYEIDPYRDTCAGRWVPSGDAFIVYPGKNGEALDSLRNEVFFEGLQDLRALRLLESKIGREATIALVHEGLGYKLKMDHYPWSAEWLLQLRERINRALAG